jgi:hypothetical protein
LTKIENAAKNYKSNFVRTSKLTVRLLEAAKQKRINDELDGQLWMLPERTKPNEQLRRAAVIYHYAHVFNSPVQSECGGTDGTTSKIKDVLKIPVGTKIRPILLEALKSKMDGISYQGDRKNGGGRKVVLETNSVEANIVANAIEGGMSFSMAQMPLNGHLREEGKVTVSRDAAIQVHKRLKPKVTSIKAGKQGSSDEKSAWARARFNWLTQLLIRFGGSLNEVDLEKLKVDGALCDCFNIAKMSSLSLAQVAFGDKTHKKCQIGGIGASSKKEEIRYPRDKNGNVNPKWRIQS